MRDITLEEIEIVIGASMDSNRPTSSGDFKSGLIGWAVAEGKNM